MGHIYSQADVVLCWLGGISEHCAVTITFLQDLADSATDYLTPGQVEHLWATTWDVAAPSVDAEALVQSAVEASAIILYKSPWFTRMWIV
jgi:hypothetical protein